MDVLHVAAALVSDASELLSFDQNQRQIAVFEGLSVSP